MVERLLSQFLTLSIYAFLMGFIFCDFFKLRNYIKVIWFLVLLAVSAYALKVCGEFDLALILPLPMLLAIWLGWVQKRRGV
jgi:hypothetical protein